MILQRLSFRRNRKACPVNNRRHRSVDFGVFLDRLAAARESGRDVRVFLDTVSDQVNEWPMHRRPPGIPPGACGPNDRQGPGNRRLRVIPVAAEVGAPFPAEMLRSILCCGGSKESGLTAASQGSSHPGKGHGENPLRQRRTRGIQCPGPLMRYHPVIGMSTVSWMGFAPAREKQPGTTH